MKNKCAVVIVGSSPAIVEKALSEKGIDIKDVDIIMQSTPPDEIITISDVRNNMEEYVELAPAFIIPSAKKKQKKEYRKPSKFH
jgi:hypothetical protein